MNGLAYSLLLVSIVLSVAGQLSLKRGMSRRADFQLTDLRELSRDAFVLAGFCCYGFSLLLYLRALQNLALSLAYPSISLGYVAVVVLSRVLFKEPFSSTRWFALALICAGVALVGFGGV